MNYLKKNYKKIIGTLLTLVICFSLTGCNSSTTSSYDTKTSEKKVSKETIPSKGIGDETLIQSNDDTSGVLLYLTKESKKAWDTAYAESDKPAAMQLYYSGQILEIPNGTKILLITMIPISWDTMYRVRILEGKYKGQEGFIFPEEFKR